MKILSMSQKTLLKRDYAENLREQIVLLCVSC